MIDRLATTCLVMLLILVAGCANPHRPAGDTTRGEPIAPATSTAEPAATLLTAAMKLIEPFEGRRHAVYFDTTGHATIGIGFNLDRPGAAEDLARLLPTVNHRALRRGTQRLTDAQIDTLLRHDVQRAIQVARRHIPNFDELPRDAQLVLVDMSFNLGSLSTWRDLRAALAAADFDAAAAAMHDSRWRTQTGRRAKHLIALMDSLG